MASRPSPLWQFFWAALAVLVIVIDLPASWKSALPASWNPDFHFGLDLAGGTQLDFRISENEMNDQLAALDKEITDLEKSGASGQHLTELRNERLVVLQQQQTLVEAIRTVLERRINGLGVSEATITPSYIGGEKHLLVECPGVVDTQKCIATVGKTIQLEFKEEFTEATKEFESSVRAKVDASVLRMTKSGALLSTLGQDLGSQLGMAYEADHLYFRDQLPLGLEGVWNAKPSDGVLQKEGTIKSQKRDDKGNLIPDAVPGIFLVQVVSPRTETGRIVNEAPVALGILASEDKTLSQSFKDAADIGTLPPNIASTLRAMKAGELHVASMDDGSAQLLFLRSFVPGHEEVNVSHILIAYKGAASAPATVTRTKAEALERARTLKQQLGGGANFETLARAESDGPSKLNGGHLIGVTHGSVVPSFEQVAFSASVGRISDPVETPFGYHLIRVDSATHMTKDTASFDALTIPGPNAAVRGAALIARLQNGQVRRREEGLRLRTLFFSLRPTGWKDTQLDGKHFRTAAVTQDPSASLPVVQIVFDDEGGKLFQELTKRNIGKRIAIFVGGELVSAPTVQGEISGGSAIITGSQNFEEAKKLAQDLNTGAIPAPIHLSGQRTVEATLGAESLHTSILGGIVGMIIVMLYMLFVYRFLGVLANIALVIYAAIFLAILKLPLFLLSHTYIVLTLAGAAGMILSIGMAVDCNVLVFERVKEELKRGKMLRTAVELGFERAWPSIRDSNISTIITCVLLFMIGTSIVRGFAVTLGMGVVISMFTGMVITRWMSRQVANSSLAQKSHLFPGHRSDANPDHQ